jgi:hypothetical protein
MTVEPNLTRDARGRWVRDDTALAILIDELATTMVDGFTILIGPEANRERMGAVIDRIQELREISRSIDPNGGDVK